MSEVTVLEVAGGVGVLVRGSVDEVLDALRDELVQHDGAVLFQFAHTDELVEVLAESVSGVRPATDEDLARAGVRDAA